MTFPSFNPESPISWGIPQAQDSALASTFMFLATVLASGCSLSSRSSLVSLGFQTNAFPRFGLCCLCEVISVRAQSGPLPIPILAEVPREPPLPLKTTLFIERNEKHLLK